MGNGVPARRPVDLPGEPRQGLSQLSLLPEKAVSNCRFVLKLWLHVSDLLHLENRQIITLFFSVQSPCNFLHPSCPILALLCIGWLIELGIIKSSPLISFLPVDRPLAFLRRHEARYVEDNT